MKILLAIVGVLLTIAILRLASRNWKRAAQILAGYGLYSAWSWLYDEPIWFAVIGFFVYLFGNIQGTVVGSVVLTLGALVNNFIFLVYYQKKGKDWLGVHTFEHICREMKEHVDNWHAKAKNHPTLLVLVVAEACFAIFSLLYWALKKNKTTMFFVLSIVEDSFITTAFVRGKVGGKLSGKDYAVFAASTSVGCIYWSIRNGILFGVAKAGFSWVLKLLN